MSILDRAAKAAKHSIVIFRKLLLSKHYIKNFFAFKGTYFGIYPNFNAATKAIPINLPVSYDSALAAHKHYDLINQINPRDYAIMFWLSRLISKGHTTLFDFGGHIGVKYYAYTRYLNYPNNFTWKVCDLPAIIAEGKIYAQGTQGVSHLSFTPSLADASGASIFFAAGSLQYLQSSLAEMISTLSNKPKWILISGVPLTDLQHFVTLQNIGVAICPYSIQNRTTFINDIKAQGYTLIDDWLNPEKQCKIPFCPDYDVVAYSGFLFELNASE